MPKNESVEFYLRFLNDRFAAFQQALNEMLNCLTQHDAAKKIEAVRAALKRLEELGKAMSPSDHPSWLPNVRDKMSWYVNRSKDYSDSGMQLLSTVYSHKLAIDAQKWKFDSSSASAVVDFSEIYKEYYQQSRVPQLFDELVALLEKILASNEIDSIQFVKELERLIASIKRNAKGDYLSSYSAWQYAGTFVKHLTVEIIESIPVVKQVFKALRKTMDDLDIEMAEVIDNAQKKITGEIKGPLPLLDLRQKMLPPPADDEGNTQPRLQG